jgi:hypothetical protein
MLTPREARRALAATRPSRNASPAHAPQKGEVSEWPLEVDRSTRPQKPPLEALQRPLPGATILLSIRPDLVPLGWLFLAALLQSPTAIVRNVL